MRKQTRLAEFWSSTLAAQNVVLLLQGVEDLAEQIVGRRAATTANATTGAACTAASVSRTYPAAGRFRSFRGGEMHHAAVRNVTDVTRVGVI